MPNEIYSALLGALVGALVTYWLGIKLVNAQFRNALDIAKIERSHLAEANFRASFAGEIARFRMQREDATDIFLEGAPKHAAAIEKFFPYVRPNERKRYRELATEYLHPNFVDEHLRTLSHDKLLAKIESLLEFSAKSISAHSSK